MAKRRITQQKPTVDEVLESEPYNAIDEEARPGETLDEYMQRRDEEEGRKHDANESRWGWIQERESWDPNMGDL